MKEIDFLSPSERDIWEHRWDAVKAELDADSASALMRLYDYYGTAFFDWLAGLYDAKTGCFYYSVSARDNEGFLPDCESTAQTLSIMTYAGMLDHVNGSYLRAFSREMAEKCSGYIQSLQDPDDGYFPHLPPAIPAGCFVVYIYFDFA